jgi:hypothetical protein
MRTNAACNTRRKTLAASHMRMVIERVLYAATCIAASDTAADHSQSLPRETCTLCRLNRLYALFAGGLSKSDAERLPAIRHGGHLFGAQNR